MSNRGKWPFAPELWPISLTAQLGARMQVRRAPAWLPCRSSTNQLALPLNLSVPKSLCPWRPIVFAGLFLSRAGSSLAVPWPVGGDVLWLPTTGEAVLKGHTSLLTVGMTLSSQRELWLMAGEPLLMGSQGPLGCRCERLLPGCHHDCFLSCINSKTVWNRPLTLAFFYLWVGEEVEVWTRSRAG